MSIKNVGVSNIGGRSAAPTPQLITPDASHIVENERMKKEIDDQFYRNVEISLKMLKNAEKFEKMKEDQRFFDDVFPREMCNRMTQ